MIIVFGQNITKLPDVDPDKTPIIIIYISKSVLKLVYQRCVVI